MDVCKIRLHSDEKKGDLKCIVGVLNKPPLSTEGQMYGSPCFSPARFLF